MCFGADFNALPFCFTQAMYIARACECIEANAKSTTVNTGIVQYNDKGELQDEGALLKMAGLEHGVYVTRLCNYVRRRPEFILQSLFVQVWLWILFQNMYL